MLPSRAAARTAIAGPNTWFGGNAAVSVELGLSFDPVNSLHGGISCTPKNDGPV